MGGISGILFAVLAVPSFLPPPDTPVVTSASQDVIDYFNERQDGILTNNGLLLVFAAFFSLWFLGVLYGLLRGAEGEGYAVLARLARGGSSVRSIDAGGSSGRDRLPGHTGSVRKLPAGRPAGLPLAGALRPDVSLRFCWYVGANSCGLAGGARNRRPAKVAGLGRFPIRPRSPAAFSRPAGRVANIAMDHSGFPAQARWSY